MQCDVVNNRAGHDFFWILVYSYFKSESVQRRVQLTIRLRSRNKAFTNQFSACGRLFALGGVYEQEFLLAMCSCASVQRLRAKSGRSAGEEWQY